MGRIPFPVGKCRDCGAPNKMLITKRCFDQPGFCYQNFKEHGRKVKAQSKVKQVVIRRIRKKSVNDIPSLIEKAVQAFHSWVKRRDALGNIFVCISCDKAFKIAEAQCGHYLPAGNNAGVRFDARNGHSQCSHCNIDLNGNQKEYRLRLIKKIGLMEVLALEAKSKEFFKWDREYLIAITNKYKS